MWSQKIPMLAMGVSMSGFLAWALAASVENPLHSLKGIVHRLSLVALIISGAAFVVLAVLLWITPYAIQKFSDPYEYLHGYSNKGIDFMVKLKIGLSIAFPVMILSFILLVVT